MKERQWWRRLGRYALPQWRGFVLIVVVMGCTVLFEALRPWPIKLIIDHVLQKDVPLPHSLGWLKTLPGAEGPAGLLGWLTAGTVLLFFSGWLSRMVQGYLQAGVGNRLVYALGADLFGHLQRLSLRFHGRRSTGDLVKRVTGDCDCVRRLIINVLLRLVTASLTIMGMIAILWKLDATLTLVAVGVAPILGLCVRRFARPMEERTYEQYKIQGEVMALAEQTLVALPVVKAFTREAHQDGRFAEAWRRVDAAYRRMTASQIQFNIGARAVTAAGTAAVMVLGGYHVLAGSLTIGSLVVFMDYLVSLYDPIETLAYLSTEYANAAAGARRVLEMLDSDEGVADKPNAQELGAGVRGEVRFENMTVGYERDRPVLHCVNLTALPGETIAIVGATGSGKSTLMSLIPRLLEPWEGRVTLDGIDVRDVQLASLRAQISIVLQEPFILPLTIADNVAYGRREASMEEIEAAAEAANAVEFIRDLPQGFDTVVGERGATLSVGQRQRLAIARALLKNSPVLILDEPTSALDAGTESLIVEALEHLMRGRTTFIIAHRLSMVRKATRILVLDHGRIVEEGLHEELLARRGPYYRLHERYVH